MNLSLPSKPVTAGPAMQPQAFVDAFSAGVAHERAKWVSAGASISLIGEHASADAIDWSAIAADLNVSGGLAAGAARTEASAIDIAAEMNAEFGVSRQTGA